jgi:hypothetical protein
MARAFRKWPMFTATVTGLQKVKCSSTAVAPGCRIA